MKLWDRREYESEIAYQRFVLYLRLGRQRSLRALWQQIEPERSQTHRVPRYWRALASNNEWDYRAKAWDKRSPEAKLRRQEERDQRLQMRVRRVGELIEEALAAVDKAKLLDVSKEEARKLLPSLRPLIRDMLKLEAQLDAPTGEFTGASLETYQALKALIMEELALEKIANAQLEPVAIAPPAPVALPAPVQGESSVEAPVTQLLVCLGPDPALHIDLAMARSARARTKMRVQVITDCTSHALETHLRRERDHLRPVRWLHLACHGGVDGIVFADGLVDGAWLSAHLDGIEVLLIAACKGHFVAEWLAVVPHVVTFSEDVTHGDAAVFARRFWTAIARGDLPDTAVDVALRHAPKHLAEFLVKHW